MGRHDTVAQFAALARVLKGGAIPRTFDGVSIDNSGEVLSERDSAELATYVVEKGKPLLEPARVTAIRESEVSNISNGTELERRYVTGRLLWWRFKSLHELGSE